MIYKNLDELPLANSTLKVVASENLDISGDLNAENNKSIAELLQDASEKENKDNKKNTE